jgi:hypothetical protein
MSLHIFEAVMRLEEDEDATLVVVLLSLCDKSSLNPKKRKRKKPRVEKKEEIRK